MIELGLHGGDALELHVEGLGGLFHRRFKGCETPRIGAHSWEWDVAVPIAAPRS